MLELVVDDERSQHRSKNFIKLLDEVDELQKVLRVGGDRSEILDEVVDVVYFANELAREFGLHADTVREYTEQKGRIRASMGKQKRLELFIARGIIQSFDERMSDA